MVVVSVIPASLGMPNTLESLDVARVPVLSWVQVQVRRRHSMRTAVFFFEIKRIIIRLGLEATCLIMST